MAVFEQRKRAVEAAAPPQDPQAPTEAQLRYFFGDAVTLEYPSGNWAGLMEADLAADLIPYWNATKADDNQILTVLPMRAAYAVDRGASPAPPPPDTLTKLAHAQLMLTSKARLVEADRVWGGEPFKGIVYAVRPEDWIDISAELDEVYDLLRGASAPTPERSIGKIAAWLPCCSGPITEGGSRLHYEACRGVASPQPAPETKVELAARYLFDNRLGWSDGRAPYAPRDFWADLGAALYGEMDARVVEMRGASPQPPERATGESGAAESQAD